MPDARVKGQGHAAQWNIMIKLSSEPVSAGEVMNAPR